MKKSYSSLNLLQQKLKGAAPKGFFEYIFSSRKYLTLTVNYYDYLRGKVFVEDMLDMYEDVPSSFDIAVLIHLLYDDFITQIRKGIDNKQIAGFLIAGKKEHLSNKKEQKRVLKALNQHIFAFETIEEDIVPENGDNEKEASITIRMKESEVLRGEVFLHDLSPYLMDEHITIEELITILYLDFINQIKENGNSTSIQKNILFHLKDYE
ncbi:hypothetical protein ACFVHQ_19705 [Actinomycetes bacterium NPDC127524]